MQVRTRVYTGRTCMMMKFLIEDLTKAVTLRKSYQIYHNNHMYSLDSWHDVVIQYNRMADCQQSELFGSTHLWSCHIMAYDGQWRDRWYSSHWVDGYRITVKCHWKFLGDETTSQPNGWGHYCQFFYTFTRYCSNCIYWICHDDWTYWDEEF